MGQIHDELYEAMSNTHRRELLFALLEENPRPDSLRELDTPPDLATDGLRSSVEHHHVNLPKLADHGFIEWNPDVGRVERGPRFDEIEPLLELLVEYHEEPPETT